MKKSGLLLAFCLLFFAAGSWAQNADVKNLMKQSILKNLPQLKNGVVGSYPKHTEEFNMASDWVLARTIETTYTAFGSPATIEYTVGEDKTRDLYTYDAQRNETERIHQAYYGGAWVNQNRYSTTYNASGYETETRSEDYADGGWEMRDGTQTAYVMDGTRLSITTMKTWNLFTSIWDYAGRNTYSYSGTSVYFSSVVTELYVTMWVLSSKSEYVWTGNEVSQTIIFSYENDDWKRLSKMAVTHPDAFTTITINSTDDESGGWVDFVKITTAIDSHENVTLQQTEMFMADWSIVEAKRYQLTYSGNNLTQRITQTYAQGAWGNSFKEVFSNFASLSTDITQLDDAGITIFPNPVGKEAVIRLSMVKTGSVTLSLYSITGQVIIEENVSTDGSIVNYPLNLNGVRPGSYLLIARNKQGNQIGKARLIKE